MRQQKPSGATACHIYNRGTDKRLIFNEDADRERFLACLFFANSETLDESPGRAAVGRRSLEHWLSVPRGKPLVEIGAFCLMDNHFHLIVREVVDGGVARFMHRALVSYSKYYNSKNKRSGRLFQGPYNLKRVEDAAYLAWLVAYVHANPLDLLKGQMTPRKRFAIRRTTAGGVPVVECPRF